MDRRKWILAAVALLVVAAAAFGLSLTRTGSAGTKEEKAELAARQEERLQDACASKATYDRLKEVAFEEAVRIRNSDPANLDMLATHSIVRMESPVVKSRDEDLNVTVCSGRFVLELPPGAERGFGGERRLTADIEYAAQSAADGSGLVYQIEGAEPIIYKLAAFDLQGQRYQTAPAAAPTPEGVDYAAAEPVEMPIPSATPAPAPSPAPRAAPTSARAPPAAPRPTPRSEPTRIAEAPAREAPAARVNPSFNCRRAGTRSEKMVCSSSRLAASDRAMSSYYYSAIADADPETKRRIRRSRDAFLARRERCGDEACVESAYQNRVEEIRRIAAGDE
jgi:hypothetical protein